MKENDALTFRRGDGIAIGGVVLLALAMLIWFILSAADGSRLAVRVYQDGALLREMPLTENGEFLVSGAYENRITVKDGKAAVTESTCPGEDCVHSGWISRPGRSVVCLPNRVEIRVEGVAGTEDVDAVVR